MVDLVQEAAHFNIQLTAAQMAQFEGYQALLREWNQKISLTAIDDPVNVQIRHFLDSLTCATVMGELAGRRLIDVGTGPGFPGLPLKILYPDLQLTLVESVTKKTRFLKAVVEHLGLTGVRILDQRAETLGQQPEHRAQYDWATGRAVAALRVLVEYLLPFCKVGGHVLAQKGESALAEAEEAAPAIAKLGGGEPSFHSIQLPEREEIHYLVVIAKVTETPSAYPRRPGRPAKRPL